MAEKLNVCLLNDSFPPTIDGVANTVLNYASVIQKGLGNAVVATPQYPDVTDNYDFDVVRYKSFDTTSIIGYRAGYPFETSAIREDVYKRQMLSRYTIIIAAAKRARQIVDGSEPLISNIKVDKPVSIAVNELYDSKIKIFAHNPDEEEARVREEQEHQELSEISLDNYGSEE